MMREFRWANEESDERETDGEETSKRERALSL